MVNCELRRVSWDQRRDNWEGSCVLRRFSFELRRVSCELRRVSWN
jgi:hypothetical protein